MLLRRPFKILSLLAFLAPLLAFAYVGHFSRYIADDYCTTSVALSQGIIGSVGQWYNTWAGQYTNWILKGVVAFLGPGFPSVLPVLILILWLGVVVWTLAQIMTAVRLSPHRWLSWSLGVMLVFAVFAGIPSIIQSLYWFGASIPYTLPLVGLVFYVGFFIRKVFHASSDSIPASGLIIVFLIMLIAGGTSEVFAAFQIAVAGLILFASVVAVPSHRRHAALWLSATGVLGAVMALVLIVIAPGTAVRQSTFPQHLTLPELAIQTILASASYFVLAIGVFSPIPLLISVIFPAVTVSHVFPQNFPFRLPPKQGRKLLALSTGVAFILLMASFAPSIYAVSSTPPARVYIFPQLVLVSTACFWGIVIGLSIRQSRASTNRLTSAIVVVLLVAGPLITAIQTLATSSQFNVYATEWDSRDQTIRAAAASGMNKIEVKTLTVDMGTMAALDTIGPDPTGWVNQCAKDYYGVESSIGTDTAANGGQTVVVPFEHLAGNSGSNPGPFSISASCWFLFFALE